MTDHDPSAIPEAPHEAPQPAAAPDAPPVVSVGATVLYVADICHARDKDMRGDYVFEYVHEKNGPTRNGRPSALKGEKVDMDKIGAFRRREGDCIHTNGGQCIRPTRPIAYWRARVLAVKPGGRLDLEIDHPHGHKLGYSDVPYSKAAEALHSWHLEGA